MKMRSYLYMLIGLLFISPLAAFADNGTIYFQNNTDSSLTVQYIQCTDYPYLRCSPTTYSTSVDQQTAKPISQIAPYTWVQVTGAKTTDGYVYNDPQSGENCDLIRYYTTGIPEAAIFSKSFIVDKQQQLLFCQTSDTLAKKSK